MNKTNSEGRCVKCPAGKYQPSDDKYSKACAVCPNGKAPNNDKSVCEDCASGKAGIDGNCADCNAPSQRPSYDRTFCVEFNSFEYTAGHIGAVKLNRDVKFMLNVTNKVETSCKNVNFLVQLCNTALKQCYTPTDVTIGKDENGNLKDISLKIPSTLINLISGLGKYIPPSFNKSISKFNLMSS